MVFLMRTEKKKEKKSKRLGRFAKRIAKQATGGGEEGEKDQKTVLTGTTNHEGFKTGPIDPAVFEIGSDYTEQAYYGSGGG